jgi:hypothetical protein
LLAARFLLATFLGLVFDPEDEGVCTSETSVNIDGTTWRYSPEDSALHSLFYDPFILVM